MLTRNAGSADLRVDATRVGKDLLVTLVGGKAHVGAVALGGFHRRSYASVLTVPNHRDDIIAQEAALRISKELRQSCVVNMNPDNHDASEGQVTEIVDASFSLVNELIEAFK